ncbi:hypothetical protein ES708_28796 [subsurface metagenome]
MHLNEMPPYLFAGHTEVPMGFHPISPATGQATEGKWPLGRKDFIPLAIKIDSLTFPAAVGRLANYRFVTVCAKHSVASV